MNFPLTAGASRALDLAAGIARRLGSENVQPLHLLWGLLLDESRAAAVLARSGLTQATLQAVCPLPESGDEPPAGDLPARSAPIDEVLLIAFREAARLGEGEVGSEHLLAGLAQIDSAANGLLAKHGLTGTPKTQAEEQVAPPLTPDEHVRASPSVADPTDTYRILDAAANRLREGLRVLEDFVRFSLDDRFLMRTLKTLRHGFTEALLTLNGPALLSARDTRADIGTEVHTDREHHRASLLDVARAAFKRAQEASRTLEECGKILDRGFATTAGRLRYELYTLEKAVLRTQSARERLQDCRLYLLLTEALCPHGSGPVVRAALRGGVQIVQVREKRMPDRELLEHARRVREWTATAGALLIVNDRPDLAVLSQADGVHVGQDELSVRDARRIVGPDRLVGVSTHSLEQARQAVLDGADYIGVGPVFHSATKSFSDLAGLALVREVAGEISLPAFAIGGITPSNAGEVRNAGARRIAVSGAICGAEDPEAAARDLAASGTS